MKKKWMILVCVILAAAVTGVGFYVRNRQTAREREHSVVLRMDGKETAVPIDSLDVIAFQGETVNGKGEHFHRSYRGIEMRDLLSRNGAENESVTGVRAVSADQYSAEFSGDEVREENRVYLAVSADGKTIEGINPGEPGVQVIVFGDPDSKRAVRNLYLLEVGTGR